MKDLICIHTKNKLENSADLLKASGSTYSYPVIDGIPVLLPDPSQFLAQTYYQYGKYIIKQEEAARRFGNGYQGFSFRKNAADNLQKSMGFNLRLIQQAIATTEKYFTKAQLLSAAANDKLQDLQQVKAFQYLKRDWCGLPDAEEQLRIIRNSLSSIISRFASDTQSALVLGAGLGRIAWDISDHFDHLFATDLAWPMATFYNRIANGQPINFADINLSQIAYNIHSTKNLMASAAAVGYNEQQATAINDRISYFISDATRLPLPDRSISCIISVFFTDVLPFQQVFPEINRVLKEDGLFIHFGPLGNNFSQVQSMFTAEDIRSYMFRYGFEGVYENSTGSYHMKSGEKMHADFYDNWIYAARKKETANEQLIADQLTADSIISFHTDFRFTITGEKGITGEQITHTLFNCYKGKEYKDARSVIEFLFLVNGKKTVGELAEEYGKQTGSADAMEPVLSLTRFLIHEQILTTTKTQ
jgi:carnosine N-methyltransferase